jgi:hypothetical protein
MFKCAADRVLAEKDWQEQEEFYEYTWQDWEAEQIRLWEAERARVAGEGVVEVGRDGDEEGLPF